MWKTVSEKVIFSKKPEKVQNVKETKKSQAIPRHEKSFFIKPYNYHIFFTKKARKYYILLIVTLFMKKKI